MNAHTHDVDDIHGLRNGLSAAQRRIRGLEDEQRPDVAPAVPTTEEWGRVRKAVEGLQSDIGRVWKYARGLEDRVAQMEAEHAPADAGTGGAA